MFVYFFRLEKTSRNSKRKFIIYFCYVFGFATSFVIFGYLMDIYLFDYGPQIGVENCTINDFFLLQLIYHFFPRLLIIFINSVLNVKTILKICRARKIQSINSASNMNYQINMVWVYIRLFFLTGFMWITNVISYIFHYDFLMYATMTVYFLQGILVFILFVCNSDVLQKLSR